MNDPQEPNQGTGSKRRFALFAGASGGLLLIAGVVFMPRFWISPTQEPAPAAAALSPGTHGNLSSNYTIRVVFDSITVHEDHEGWFHGDGEYDLVAYVQATKLDLTKPSGPGDGIWDAVEGTTYVFAPGTELTVSLPSTMPLVVFTLGAEVDLCGRNDFYRSAERQLFGAASHGPTLLDDVKRYQKEWSSAAQYGFHESGPTCRHDDGIHYPLDTNEQLGLITNLYSAPDFGAGAHTNVKSDQGDYTLRYTITVTPPLVLDPGNG